MARRSKSRDSNAIRQDFLDAIDRIKAGKPQDPDLRELVKKRKLKLDVSTVAKEAGRSRTLIARAECAYPEVRSLIMLEKESGIRPVETAQDVANSLRKQLAEKTEETKRYMSAAQEPVAE
jgi:hypothetical protein